MLTIRFKDRAGVKRSIDASIQSGLFVGVLRVAKRGKELIADGVPRKSDRLARGIEVDHSSFVRGRHHASVDVTASAIRPAEAPTVGTLHMPNGHTRDISLRGSDEFDYARAVFEGTGIYGPNGAPIYPREAKAFTIPIDGPPRSGSYITARGKIYITVTPPIKGQRPQDTISPAVAALEQGDAINLITDALAESFQ